ncbi:MAG: 23S rRNA (uracil(1939)-C(5))-methyltransferase RlmD [Clostridia bacterium]
MKNNTYSIVINDFGCNGEGVSRVKENAFKLIKNIQDGKVIFVKNALPKEEVEVLITKQTSNYLIGEVKSIKQKSTQRIIPKCKYFGKCDGCQIQHMNQDLQIDFKTTAVKNEFAKQHINCKINNCIPSENQFEYRNKISLQVGLNYDIGFFDGKSRNLIKIDKCMLCESWNENVIDVFNQYFQTLTQKQNKVFKQIIARKINDSILITLIVAIEKLENKELLQNLLNNKFSNFGLYISVNKIKNSNVFVNESKHVCGLKFLEFVQNNNNVEVGSQGFLQINNNIAQKIYNQLGQNLINCDLVVNAYSGAGLLSATLAKSCKKVIGIEVCKDAHLSAQKLKLQNNISNLTNILGKTEEELPKLFFSCKKEQNVAVILDPPRKGCDKVVMQSLIQTMPNTIFYLSCFCSTLTRDISILINSKAYEVLFVQPYDMFPQTKHIETLVCLMLNKNI